MKHFNYLMVGLGVAVVATIPWFVGYGISRWMGISNNDGAPISAMLAYPILIILFALYQVGREISEYHHD